MRVLARLAGWLHSRVLVVMKGPKAMPGANEAATSATTSAGRHADGSFLSKGLVKNGSDKNKACSLGYQGEREKTLHLTVKEHQRRKCYNYL